MEALASRRGGANIHLNDAQSISYRQLVTVYNLGIETGSSRDKRAMMVPVVTGRCPNCKASAGAVVVIDRIATQTLFCPTCEHTWEAPKPPKPPKPSA